jgi:hypothetical protein
MAIAAIAVIFLDDIGSRLGIAKSCRTQVVAGPVRRLISNRSRLRAPHIGGCANPIDTGSGKVPTPNWGMCTKSGGRHQHNRRTQFSGCQNCSKSASSSTGPVIRVQPISERVRTQKGETDKAKV